MICSFDSDEPLLGIDLGGTTITVTVTDATGNLLGLAEDLTGDHRKVSPVIDRIVRLIHTAIHSAGMIPADFSVAGIGLPGEVEVQRGLLRASPILPTWREIPVGQLLLNRTGIRFSVANDANAALLGEYFFGAAHDADPVLMLTMGTGIGGAVLSNGKLMEGYRGSAGEIGHVCLAVDGPLCWCGQRGCLGMLASTTALLANYKKLAAMDARKDIDGPLLARRFHDGDHAAQEALNLQVSHLVRGIAIVACVIAPERVVLSGGILDGLAGPLIQRIRARLSMYSYPEVLKHMSVVTAELGRKAGAIGASTLPWVTSSN